MYTQIEIQEHFEGKLKIAYLNQPQLMNALNKVTILEITEFIKKCNEDDTVRAIAISGHGKAFCSGQNLDEAFTIGKDVKEKGLIKKIVLDYYNPMVTTITRSKKPVVALVNGPAVGAGAMLALICDFTLASEKAYFSQAFSKIGLIPDTGGTYYLPKLLGRQLATYLAFTGKKIYAEEAKGYGLVAEVFSEEDFYKSSLEILENIANMPTRAFTLTKKAFFHSYKNSLVEQLDLEAKLQQEAAETSDFTEGVSAFLEKRKPEYKGK